VHRVGVTALALALVAGIGSVATAAVAAPSGGHHVYPSREQVHAARDRATRAADDVSGIKAALAAADLQLQTASIRAEQAAEAYNGARWQLQQARREARVAERHARLAGADATEQRNAYAATVVTSYELGPSLSPLSAVTDSNGLDTVVSKLSTIQTAQSTMDHTYDSFVASSTLAKVASDQADAARTQAAALATRAKQARDQAEAAAAAADAAAQSIAAQKTILIHRLARLQHVSVALAEQRRTGIEQAAEEAARQAALREARRRARAQAAAQAQQAAQQAQQDSTSGSTSGTTGPPTSDPTPEPTPTTPPSPPTDPPAPASGANAAIAFARSQIGDPYVWGAAGPDAWDCSGLTMGAWRAGGISLPHYSVAQYLQSTPISRSALRPGDLVFWGSSGSASSIYHVALYVGNGMIIQAPRTGRDVEEVSMYYWIPPTFFARP
jgi:cell wall-associated NlpC family hydrolase